MYYPILPKINIPAPPLQISQLRPCSNLCFMKFYTSSELFSSCSFSVRPLFSHMIIFGSAQVAELLVTLVCDRKMNANYLF